MRRYFPETTLPSPLLRYISALALAEKVLKTLEQKECHFKPLYEDGLSLTEKIETVAKEIYGADGVSYAPAALKECHCLSSFLA